MYYQGVDSLDGLLPPYSFTIVLTVDPIYVCENFIYCSDLSFLGTPEM
jgi:hypothetical protein